MSKDKDNKVDCMSCGFRLDQDHTGIKCGNGHHLCPDECSENFVTAMMSDPVTNIPVNCALCKVPVIVGTFERHLDPDQITTYLSVVAMKQISPDEEMGHCPFCPYFEIWSKGARGMSTMYCKGCSRTNCIVCKGEIIPPADGGFDDEEWDDEDRSDETSYIYHMECADLSRHLKAFNEAIEKGAGVACPSCGHFGRKDNACTHMRCPACQGDYCYVCGVADANLNKANRKGTIYSHNKDWETNPLRCPMYLTQIGEVDDRWDQEDDEECMILLTRLRTISNLREVVQEMGLETFRVLAQKYASVRNCGYTEDEILNEDVTLYEL